MGSGAHDRKLQALLDALSARSGQTVSLPELAGAASYKTTTLRDYLRKNMLVPRVILNEAGNVRIGDLTGFTLHELRRALSQRANRYTWEHIDVSELVSSLLDRSRTNAGLALELINRPELANRLDAFVLLFHTAWEQLLKAELERRDAGSIFTGATSASGRPATIGMHQVLERTIPSTRDPMRRNIEWLKEMRDGAAHLLVPEVTGIATRYFQSSILNYIGRFQAITGEPPFRFEGTGLLTLGVAYTSPTLDALRARHGPNAEEVKALIERLERDAEEADDSRFAVTIRYELVLDKKAGPEAIRLVNAAHGVPVAPVLVPKDPKKVCPYRATECADMLTERTGTRWSAGAVANVAGFLKVKDTDNEYHFSYHFGKSYYHTYSERFVEFVAERFRQNPDLIKDATPRRDPPKRRPRRG